MKMRRETAKSGGGRLQYSVQLTFFAIYFIFIALMTGLLNTYPTIGARDAAFASKKSLMINQASIMSSSLSALERLGAENVRQVMELIDVNAFDRVLVTDETGLALYDTAAADNAEGRYVPEFLCYSV